MTTEPNTLFRYVDKYERINLVRYPIRKRTPKGCWIDMGGHTKLKFVLDIGIKRFAYPHPADARESFFARKKRQLAILEYRVESVQRAVQALKDDRVGVDLVNIDTFEFD